jgi:hypothetical protein
MDSALLYVTLRRDFGLLLFMCMPSLQHYSMTLIIVRNKIRYYLVLIKLF